MEIECEPCNCDDKHVAAIAWCSECEEAFCSACEKAHKRMKMSKDHHIIGLRLMPSGGQSEILSDKLCKEHTQMAIDAFCTQTVVLPQRSFSRLEFTHQFDISPKGWVYGIAATEDDHLIICNENNKLLMKCDFKGNAVQHLTLESDPNNITLIPNTITAVVTLPGIKSIQFVDVKNWTKGKTVKLPDQGRGISASSEIIAVGGVKSIYILNTEGQHLRTFTVQTSFTSAVQYLKICSNGNITYTDTKAVYRINRNGEQIWKYQNTNLIGSQGVTQDKQGSIHVVYQNSNSMIKLSETGEYQDTLLEKKDNLLYPWALCFSPSNKNLFIANNQSIKKSFISVYNCINR